MAMQVRTNDKAGLRAFNPDRDLVWALPRLLRRALEQLGEEWTAERLVTLLEEHGCPMPCDGLVTDGTMKATDDVIRGLAHMFTTMRDFPESAEAHANEYKRLKELCPLFHMLLASLLMDVIFAELPTWFDQVRPTSKLDPMPDVDVVMQAADAFLDRINSKG